MRLIFVISLISLTLFTQPQIVHGCETDGGGDPYNYSLIVNDLAGKEVEKTKTDYKKTGCGSIPTLSRISVNSFWYSYDQGYWTKVYIGDDGHTEKGSIIEAPYLEYNWGETGNKGTVNEDYAFTYEIQQDSVYISLYELISSDHSRIHINSMILYSKWNITDEYLPYVNRVLDIIIVDTQTTPELTIVFTYTNSSEQGRRDHIGVTRYVLGNDISYFSTYEVISNVEFVRNENLDLFAYITRVPNSQLKQVVFFDENFNIIQTKWVDSSAHKFYMSNVTLYYIDSENYFNSIDLSDEEISIYPVQVGDYVRFLILNDYLIQIDTYFVDDHFLRFFTVFGVLVLISVLIKFMWTRYTNNYNTT